LSIAGAQTLINSILLAATQVTVPNTTAWHWQGTPIIIGTSLLILVLAGRNIRYPHVGPKMPLGPFESFFNSPSVGTFIGSIAFGHVIGVPIVLGLANLGLLN
jgi:photosystem I subunit 10